MALIPNEERQEYLLDYWIAHPTESYEDIAKATGIPSRTFDGWRQRPEFMEKYHERCRRKFGYLEAAAMRNLKERLERKDWHATKYVLDGLGYQAVQKVDISTDNVITISIEDEQ